MVRLVDDLLDVSRITRNKIELRKERVELATVVAQCRRDEPAAHRAVRATVLGDAHADAGLPGRRPGAAGPGRSGNLLNNAAKYTEPGGQDHG